MNRHHLLNATSLLLASLVLSNLYADEPSFHGFFSKAMLVSSNNPFYNDESGTHFNYHEIGLNASWQLTDNLRTAGQLLSRKAGGISDSDPKVDLLLLDYQLLSGDNQASGIRLGRVKNPYGIHNATRDVPHVRPGVFVPQSVYFETFRDAVLSVDGVNLYLNLKAPLGDVNIDLYGGTTPLDSRTVEYQIYGKEIDGDFNEAETLGIKFSLVPESVPNLTVALTMLDFSLNLEGTPSFTPFEQFNASTAIASNPSTFTDYITALQVDSLLTLASVQYNWQQWGLTLEYLDIDTELPRIEVLHQPSAPVTASSKAYYLQAEWLGSDKYSIYARHEKLYYNTNDKNGAVFAEKTGGNPVTQYTIANTVGARWYFNPSLLLTGEYSRNQGAAFINGTSNIDHSTLEEDWDLFILQLSYHF